MRNITWRNMTWSAIAVTMLLTILPACSSPPQPKPDYDKVRSHAGDAERNLESEEGKHH